MKTLALAKIGVALALGAATLPGLCATSTIAAARGDGGGNGGGGAASGGGGGSEGGGGSVLTPATDNLPPRNPPDRNPPGGGTMRSREIDRALPSCIHYRRETYGFFVTAVAVRCHAHVRFYYED